MPRLIHDSTLMLARRCYVIGWHSKVMQYERLRFRVGILVDESPRDFYEPFDQRQGSRKIHFALVDVRQEGVSPRADCHN